MQTMQDTDDYLLNIAKFNEFPIVKDPDVI